MEKAPISKEEVFAAEVLTMASNQSLNVAVVIQQIKLLAGTEIETEIARLQLRIDALRTLKIKLDRV